MSPVITLLTDFGMDDPYVAQMKGAILSRLPETVLVDLSHDIPPYDLMRAALFLAASRSHFPRGTIFCAVVDPGVGTARRIVALRKDDQFFLAPDNGLLGLVLSAPGQEKAWDLSAHTERAAISSTFHGRDVFAPLAAKLGAGKHPQELGTEISPTSLIRLPWTEPTISEHPMRLRVAILHVDHFGNCLTNLSCAAGATRLAPGTELTITTEHGSHPATRVQAYAELANNRLGLLPGSQGYLELALNQSSAAQDIELKPGDSITVSIQGDESR